MHVHRFLLAPALLAAALFAGCADGATGTLDLLGTSTVDYRPVAAPGIAPTHSPAPSGAQLVVKVLRIDVAVVAADDIAGVLPADDHADGHAMPSATPDVPATTSWITVMDTPTAIDLFDTSGVHGLVANLIVPAGRITQMRLVLAPDPTYVAPDGTTSAPTCPSCTETGIKVVMPGTLTVAPGSTVDLTLDFTATFDAARGMLDPVIVVGSVRT
jgi:hypothetical protein